MSHRNSLAWGGVGRAWLAGLILLSAAGPAWAETGKKLDEVVVSAPIIAGNQVNDLGSQVTVVTEKQIEDLNANDLPSALRRTPGVVISRHNPIGSFGGGAGGAIFIRGLGSGRPGQDIATLLDGVPVFVGVWTHSVMDVLSIDNLESIQVYKGAQPALLGNMSFGAVNLLPKYKQEDGYYTRFKVAGGSYNTLVEVAEHAGKVQGFDYWLGQSYRYSDGHREDSGGSLENYYANLGYSIGQTLRLGLLVNHTHNWADDPGPEGQPQLRDGTFKTRDRITILKLENKNTWGQGQAKAYWDQGHLDWQDQSDGSDTRTDYDNYGLRLGQTLKPWSGGSLTLGWDQDYISGKVLTVSGTGKQNQSQRETFRLAQPYAALSQEIGLGAWTLIPSLGGRYFDHNQYGAETGYQAGLVLRRTETELHANFAHTYNYPGVYVVQQSNLFWGGSTLWKDLKPEELDHFEIGVGQRFNRLVKADLTYFKDKGSNRLIFLSPPPYPPRWENLGDFDNQGVEATLTLTPTRELALFLGGTYLHSDPGDLPFAPEWSGSLGANWQICRGLTLSLDGAYLAEQYVTDLRYSGARSKVDGFAIINAKLNYAFKAWQSDWSVFVAGENLTDQEYAYKKDYPMPGINGMLGLEVRF